MEQLFQGGVGGEAPEIPTAAAGVRRLIDQQKRQRLAEA